MEIKFELASEKRQQKSTSPTNVNAFPSEGWMTRTRPIACTISGRTGDIISYNNYYFEAEQVLCTRAFSISAVGTAVDDGESPPGSTELDDETGHNCKMPHSLYRIKNASYNKSVSRVRILMPVDHVTTACPKSVCKQTLKNTKIAR